MIKTMVSIAAISLLLNAVEVFSQPMEGEHTDLKIEMEKYCSFWDIGKLLAHTTEKSDSDLQHLLDTTLYSSGAGVSENDSESLRYFLMSAKRGDERAQLELGKLYADGRGVSIDYKESLGWYLLAAEQGNSDAQAAVGVMYATGRGTPQNTMMAYVWISIATTQGNESARSDRDLLFSVLTKEQLARGQDIAARCFETAFKKCSSNE